MMIKRKCTFPNCNEFAVPNHSYCEKHLEQSQKNRQAFFKAKRTNTEFYNSSQWRRLRKEVIAAAPFCACCGGKDNLQVDHITPPRGNADLFFDKDNLQVLCRSCHLLKTLQEIKERKNNG